MNTCCPRPFSVVEGDLLLPADVLVGSPRTRRELGPTETLKDWNANFLSFPREELVKLVVDIFQDICADEFPIEEEYLRNFLNAVASHYRDNPYHSFLHACYVLHATWMIWTTTDLPLYFAPHEKLALFIAAMCHDVGHDGRTNQFHVNAKTEIAKRYNDLSVLENHHCALTLAILETKSCAILDCLSEKMKTQFKIEKLIVEFVLGTDMSRHDDIKDGLYRLEIPRSARQVSVGSKTDTEVDKVFLGKAVLHAADISNPVRSFEIELFMAEGIQREFKLQADKEKELGLPFHSWMDIRNDAMKYQSEVYFIRDVVEPLWRRFAELFPGLEICLKQMEENKKRFEALAEFALKKC